MNPLANPYIRLGCAAAFSTWVTPRVLVKIAPGLGGVVNPATGRFALPSDSTDDEIRVARQAVIGTSAGITAMLFIGIGMLVLGKGTVEAAAKVAG